MHNRVYDILIVMLSVASVVHSQYNMTTTMAPMDNSTMMTQDANMTTMVPAINMTMMTPVTNMTTMAPATNMTTMGPVTNMTTMAPVANVTTMEPTFNMTTMAPVTNMTTMAPVTNTTTMTPQTTPVQPPLNCTNIPEVPMKPYDGNITSALALANENIRVCNLIIPFLNRFIANLKSTGVYQQINQIMNLMKYLQMRIDIINRRLDCGLVMSVEEARRLKQMMHNDQVSKRVLYGVKMRLTDIKKRLSNIY